MKVSDSGSKVKITSKKLIPHFDPFYRTPLLNAYSLFKVHILMLLAKIKGNKVHFGKLVTFLGEGGSIYPLLTP